MKQTERQKKEGGEGGQRGSDRNREGFYERERVEKREIYMGWVWDKYMIQEEREELLLGTPEQKYSQCFKGYLT